MASKSIDWDELLLTNDPKKKEIEVSFKKIDGEGTLISKGNQPGTPGGANEGGDGVQEPDKDDEGDFDDETNPGDGGPIEPGDTNDCEVWDCAKWREYADAGYDQFEDDGNWATRVAKLYVTEREFDTLGPDVLHRKIVPANENVISRNRSDGTLTQWKNFVETASPFYAPRSTRTHGSRESGGEAAFNLQIGYDQHEDQAPISIGADFNAGAQPEDRIMCDALAHQSNSIFSGRFASDLDYAFGTDGVYDQNFKSVFEGEGFAKRVVYGWDGYNVFDRIDGPNARGYLEDQTTWISRLYEAEKLGQESAPNFEEDRSGRGLAEFSEKRTYAGLYATNSREQGDYVSKTLLPTYTNDPATNKPTNTLGPQLYGPTFNATFGLAEETVGGGTSYSYFSASQSFAIHLFHNALVVRCFDSSNAEDNKVGWRVFEKDIWPADKPFLGWITVDMHSQHTTDREAGWFNNNPATNIQTYALYEESRATISINGDVVLENVPIATNADQLRYLYGEPGSSPRKLNFAYYNVTSTLSGVVLGPATGDSRSFRDTGVNIAARGLVCLALYEGQDASDLPRSRFGRGILRQLNNPETYPTYCARIP